MAVLHDTKNGERRAIPLAGPALEEMKQRSKVRRIDTDLVFANPQGVATFPRKAWHRAMRAAEIEDFRFHDLRHTFASHFLMRTGDLKALQEILGHADIKTTMRYAHLAKGHKQKAMNQMVGLTGRKNAMSQNVSKMAFRA